MKDLIVVMKALDGCTGGAGCDNCPYDGDGNCKDRLMRDALRWLISQEQARKSVKNTRIASASKYRALKEKLEQTEMQLEVTRMNLGNSREECNRLEDANYELEKKYATALEAAAIAEEQVAAEKRAVKVARAQRDAAWEKLARITGEREKAWLDDGLELRTCYCPLCDKHFEVRSNASAGNCPDCGHHVVLREVEVADGIG